MIDRKIPLIEKYRASKLKNILGQDEAIKGVTTFLKAFPKKKALILNGPVGTGKTSITLAIAKEFNMELFELNASDLRNRSKLDEILKPATLQKSLFNKEKLILMDEADGITGSDRGGLPELISLIDKTNHPIIITANDIWHKKFSGLRKKCQLITLKELDEVILNKIISKILVREGLELNGDTISMIIKNAKGDCRAMLNDLQTIIHSGEDTFITDSNEREKQGTIFEALKSIFQSTTTSEIFNAFNDTGVDLNEVMLWVEENIPLEYEGVALERAQDALSKADLFKGRIYRQQYWRFLVYQNFFLTAGISAATKVKYNKFTNYKRPSRILKIWLANQKGVNKKSISNKFAGLNHMSKKKANGESFLFPFIIDSQMERKMDLNDKEKGYLEERRNEVIMSKGLYRFQGNN